MIPLLADAGTVDAVSPTVVGLLLGAITALSGAVVVLFWQLSKAKDAQLALAREFGANYTADKVKQNELMTGVTAEMKGVTEELRAALVERDKIVADGMDLLHEIKEDVRQVLRERTS